MTFTLPRNSARAAWAAALFVLVAFHGAVWSVHAGKYQESGDGLKYDIAAEIIKRLLFTGGAQDLDEYVKDRFGLEGNMSAAGFNSLMTDERPVFFLYLALIKLAGPAPVELHFALGLTMLLASLAMLGSVLKPPSGPLFLLMGGIFLSPYFLYQAFAYEPHVLQIAFTCASLFFFARKRHFAAFFLMTLSFFAHGANLVLLGCLGLLLLLERPLSLKALLLALLGCAAALLAVEAFLQLLFSRDHLGIFQHEPFISGFLFKSGRLRANFAKGAGLASLLKNAFIFMPLGLAGLVLVRNRLEFMLMLMPILIFAGATRGEMPGALRVLTPVFFLGYAVFMARLLGPGPRWAKVCGWVLAAFSLTLGAGYLAVASKSLDISQDAGAFASARASSKDGPPCPDAWLHWNIRRYHPVGPDESLSYGLKSITRLELPSMPDANAIQGNLVFIALSRVLPGHIAVRLGSVQPTPPICSPVAQRLSHGQ
jgi:hypothetical protein